MLQPEDGGVAEHALLLSRGLASRGWDVEVACSPGNVISGPLARAGIPTHPLAMHRSVGPSDLRALRALRALDHRRGYDIVHAHSSKAGGLVRGGLAGAHRLVYTPNCFAFAAGGSRVAARAYRAAERLLAPRSGAIIAVAEWERRLAADALGRYARRVRTIHNGVPACPEVEPAPELLEFKQGLPLAGVVAALRPQKDPLAAVRAAAELVARGGVEARVAIVGNGPMRSAVEGEIEARGLDEHVRLFAFQPPAARYLRALDLFVLPSRWEALPLAIAEAMMCELPVLATAVGGVPELVAHGASGVLVEPSDQPALAAAMEGLLSAPERRAAMGREARRLAGERFGVERMVTRTEELYSELLARGAPLD